VALPGRERRERRVHLPLQAAQSVAACCVPQPQQGEFAPGLQRHEPSRLLELPVVMTQVAVQSRQQRPGPADLMRGARQRGRLLGFDSCLM
jgi:hypothetical protein